MIIGNKEVVNNTIMSASPSAFRAKETLGSLIQEEKKLTSWPALNEFRTKIVAPKEATPKSNATLEANLSPEK